MKKHKTCKKNQGILTKGLIDNFAQLILKQREARLNLTIKDFQDENGFPPKEFIDKY